MKKAITITFGLIGLIFGLVFTSTKINAQDNDFDVSFTLDYNGSNGEVQYTNGNYTLFYNIIANSNYTLSEEGAIFPQLYRIINNSPFKYCVTDVLFTNSDFQTGSNIIKVDWGDVNNLTTVTSNTIVINFIGENYNHYNIIIKPDNTYTATSDNGNFYNDYNESTFGMSVIIDSASFDWYNYGYNKGVTDGYNNGLTDGYDNGYSEGMFNGQIEGKHNYGIFYNGSWLTAEQYGTIMYNEGFNSTEEGGAWGVLFSALFAPFQILGMELLPGVTIGMIVAVPLVFGLLAWILSAGKSKK